MTIIWRALVLCICTIAGAIAGRFLASPLFELLRRMHPISRMGGGQSCAFVPLMLAMIVAGAVVGAVLGWLLVWWLGRQAMESW